MRDPNDKSVTEPSQDELEAMLAGAPWTAEDLIGFWTPDAIDQRFLARLEHEMEQRGELEPWFPEEIDLAPPGFYFADDASGDVGDLVE